MYKIIIPFETQGFISDAKVLKCGFPDSKIYLSTKQMDLSEANIFIDRIQYIDNLNTAKINILSVNQEIVLTSKHYKWQIPYMKKLDYVFTKTKYGTYLMAKMKKKFNLKFKIYYIGHTTIFPIKNIHRRDYSSILHLAGAHEFKNTDTIIKCWLKYTDLPLIIIGCYDNCIKNSLKKYLTAPEYDEINRRTNIKFINKNIAFDDIVIMKYYYAIHLCPSITEGYGHYINEARITKSLVITSDLPPMNEFIDNKSGVLIKCDRIEEKDNGNELCLFDVDTLANVIRRIMLFTSEQINHYGQNAFNKYILDTKFFKQRATKVNKIIKNKII